MASQYELIVQEIIPLSPTAKALRYIPPQPISFEPGQFFMVEFYLKQENGFVIKDNKSPLQKRAFSISSSPQDLYLELTVKKTQDPFVAAYLVDYLQVGERALFTGPYGHFCFSPINTKTHLLFLAAGSGIAPIMSMLRYIETNQLPLEMHLIFSNKTEEEILWRSEIESIAKRNNMKHTFTLTQDETNALWKGSRGRIDQTLIHNAVKAWPREQVDCYLCGPLTFIREMERLLQDEGIPLGNIKKEIYE